MIDYRLQNYEIQISALSDEELLEQYRIEILDEGADWYEEQCKLELLKRLYRNNRSL